MADLFNRDREDVFAGAKFITTPYLTYFDPENKPWGTPSNQYDDLPECDGLPVFIKDFKLKQATEAVLYFSALGCADVYINGVRVGDDEMKPGWTNYNKRAFYCTYDVSSLVREGENRILAVVSTGWCYGRIAGGHYGKGTPAFKACLTAGSQNVVTDKTWRASVTGRIRTADIWDGEFCDGSFPSYEDMSCPDKEYGNFEKPQTVSYKGEVTPYIGTTVKVRKGLTRAPQVINISDGVDFDGTDFGALRFAEKNASLPVSLASGKAVTIDFGQEIVGRVKIKVSGKRGALVKIRYAEFLNDTGKRSRGNDGAAGSVYTANMRSALAKAYYRLGGDGEETYCPAFTFFGFRFVEITADSDVQLISAEGEVVGNDNRETGFIETDNALVNRLISNIIWGQRGNYLSVPTDCPQRDERLGWTGDAQAFSVTAAYNADVYSFFRKWMQDMRDTQGKKGEYADVNPTVGVCTGNNAAAWGDAGVIIPFNMYRLFGDKTILEEHYDSMDKYIRGLIKTRRYAGPNPRYGDWLAYDFCKNEMIASAYFVRDIDMMLEMSAVLGKNEKIAEYKEYREKAKAYFDRKFMKKGMPKGKTQTDKVIALAFNLVDEDKAQTLADMLEKQIAENGNRLSTGFLGTYLLCPTLSKYGKDKTAYNLLLQRNEPSWLYTVDQGATTMWERWNSYTKEKGFGDVGMNSFNHYAYGAIGEWMYRFMAGIQPAEPGFKTIKLSPRIDQRTADELPDGQQNITYVNASYDSAAGLIKSEWSTKNGFRYYCSVPVPAALTLPVMGKNVTVNGETRAVSEYKNEGGNIVIDLLGGEYTVEFSD